MKYKLSAGQRPASTVTQQDELETADREAPDLTINDTPIQEGY
jgi:hypothetical protein